MVIHILFMVFIVTIYKNLFHCYHYKKGYTNQNIGSRGFESKTLLSGDNNISLVFYQSATCSNIGLSIFEEKNYWDWKSRTVILLFYLI